MILVIDNYDSFTFNLVHYLLELGPEVEVVRNDALSVSQALALKPEAVLLSPGPCTPNEAGICLDLIAAAADSRLPLFGVCLGHQAIGEVYGAKVISAREILHGKSSDIEIIKETPLFEGLGTSFEGARYHSLAIDPETIAGDLTVTAVSDDGEVMAVEDSKRKVYGVQFHPESILTPKGGTILSNFLQQ